MNIYVYLMFSYYGSIYLSMKNKIENCINKIPLTFINEKIKFKENIFGLT